MTDTPMEKINGVFPVLDVSRYFAGDAGDLPRLGRELRYAFENVGFYYLRGHDVAAALIHECAPARGAHPAFDRARDRVLLAVEQGVEEVQARQLARDLAVLLQAAQLFRHAPAFVFDAFCASRLASAADAFGLLPAGLPLEALIARAMPVVAV